MTFIILSGEFAKVILQINTVAIAGSGVTHRRDRATAGGCQTLSQIARRETRLPINS